LLIEFLEAGVDCPSKSTLNYKQFTWTDEIAFNNTLDADEVVVRVGTIVVVNINLYLTRQQEVYFC